MSINDTLISEDTLEFVLGICEGEIEGLVDGEKSFFLGDTALKSASGEANFVDYSLVVTQGAPSGEQFNLKLGGAARSYSVTTRLLYNIPVVRSTQPARRNRLEARIQVNTLFNQTSSGTQGASVTLKIEYKKASDSTWTEVVDELTISGKTTSAYLKEYNWDVDPNFFGSYDVRITKMTADANTTTAGNDIAWESLQEVGTKEINYPNTALASLSLRASGQFSSLPEPSGIYRLRRIRVPVNYDPIAKTYSGTWDGTFKIAWSDNPAWAVYDLIMNDRFGVNAHYPVTANKWDFYDAAQWCDHKVPDGSGGLQPRYTMNLLVTDVRDGKELLEYMAGSFNARIIEYPDGEVGLRVDKEEDAVMLFTPENVSAEGFTYNYTDPGSRYNDITVSFTDPDLAWDTNQLRVYDQNDLDSNGRVPLDFVAVGTTNRHEALRKGFYKLITSLTETESVSFNTNRIAQVLQPYDIILVSDPKMGYGISARIVSMNIARTEITTRQNLYLEAGVTYEATFDYQGGTITRTVTTPTTGNTLTITLDAALPADIDRNASFSLGSPGQSGAPKPYRVLYVKELEGKPDRFQVSAVEVNRNKWAAVDNLEMAAPVEYSRLPTPWVVPPPDLVKFSHEYISNEGKFETTMVVTLNKQAYPWYRGDYEIWGRQGNAGGWQQISNIRWLEEGNWQIKVLPFNWQGQKTNFELTPVWNATVPSPLGPPDVSSFMVNVLDENTGVFSWSTVNDPFVTSYELRYSPDIDEENWGSMTPLGTVAGTTIMLPPRTGAYAVRAVNRWGQLSVNPTFIRTDLEGILQLNVVETLDDSPNWDGVREQVVAVDGALELDSIDTLADWDALSDVINLRVGSSGVYTSGTYYMSETVDLGQISVVKIMSTVTATGIHLANYLSTWSSLAAVESLSGTSLSDWAVSAEFRFSNNNIDWSTWRPLTYSKTGARYFQFRLQMSSNDSFITPRVSSWKVEIDVEERYLGGEDIEIPVEGKRIDFTPAFIRLKGLGVAGQGLQSGDYYEITNKTNTGFDVIFKDSGGNPVVRLLDYVATGYGRILDP